MKQLTSTTMQRGGAYNWKSQPDRLQRCAACGEVFDLDDHAEEEDEVPLLRQDQ